MEKQNVWVDGVIPSEPDAWIWAGDIVYLDDANVNCDVPSNSSEWTQQCACESTWLLKAPYSCTAGDVDHARGRTSRVHIYVCGCDIYIHALFCIFLYLCICVNMYVCMMSLFHLRKDVLVVVLF